MEGWVKIHRGIQNWELYFSEPFTKTQAWVDMIILANHQKRTINVRGNLIEVERGEIAWSEDKLAQRWKWSREKVRRFLEWLKTRQQIRQQKSPVLSKIMIENYENYQLNETTDETTEKQQTRQQTSTNKNVKNYKNEKNIYPPVVPPQFTPAEMANRFFTELEAQQTIIAHLVDKGIPADIGKKEIDKFVAYWTERNKSGTKMRWELETTFEVNRRLTTWLRNIKPRTNSQPKGIRI